MWSTKDPFGNEVTLKKVTYEEHIIKGHTGIDADFRAKATQKAPDIIQNPFYICRDPQHEKDRVHYVDLCSVEGNPKIVKVVVDTSREEDECRYVVTVIAGNSLSKRGEMLYERS